MSDDNVEGSEGKARRQCTQLPFEVTQQVSEEALAGLGQGLHSFDRI